MTANGATISNGPACPIPISEYPRILLAHGGGGKLSQQLIQKMFVPQFKNESLGLLHDGAVLRVEGDRIAFTTDSYVINPIFFPGGNIGELAINGTVNDLAMCGAIPRYLSVGFIIEEGFAMENLWRLVHSMQEAATYAGVVLVTGDTKVVDKGKGDQIFINTSGIGVIEKGVDIDPRRAAAGDAIIVSGNIAQHGIAIMSVREGLEFETTIKSDTAALNSLVHRMMATYRDIHVLRDPTRGGLASSLNEIADSAHVGIRISEENIPIAEDVKGACEIMGFDPLYVANEGKLIAFLPATKANEMLSVMKSHPQGKESQIIGEVVADHPGLVVMKTKIGGSRVVDMMSGEQLPRIC
jgi:hydrogenase expression/formation protein HypE